MVVVVVVVAIAWHFSWIVVMLAVHFQEWAVVIHWIDSHFLEWEAQEWVVTGSVLVVMVSDTVPLVDIGKAAFP